MALFQVPGWSEPPLGQARPAFLTLPELEEAWVVLAGAATCRKSEWVSQRDEEWKKGMDGKEGKGGRDASFNTAKTRASPKAKSSASPPPRHLLTVQKRKETHRGGGRSDPSLGGRGGLGGPSGRSDPVLSLSG